VGIFLPKGVNVVIQVHYNLDALDAPGPDQTRIGLYFHAKNPKNRLLTLPLLNDTFILKPGVDGQEVKASFPLDLSSLGIDLPDSLAPKFSAIRVGPHMHTLGHKISGDMTLPDGTTQPLVQIEDWEFHWQGLYDYVAPVPMPYKSKINLTCTFDNTTDHEVRWGEGTKDEMCLMYIGFIAEGPLATLLFGNPF